MIDMLTVVTGATHSIVAWFEHKGSRYAAMFESPIDPDTAREWLMKGSDTTRRLLANRKAPYQRTDGPLFALCPIGEHPTVVARGNDLMW